MEVRLLELPEVTEGGRPIACGNPQGRGSPCWYCTQPRRTERAPAGEPIGRGCGAACGQRLVDGRPALAPDVSLRAAGDAGAGLGVVRWSASKSIPHRRLVSSALGQHPEVEAGG